MSDQKEKLKDIMNDGYANLSKWLIALATGAIVFSVKLVNPVLGNFWRYELGVGLVLLMVSIIFGVRCVRLRLDGFHYDYICLVNKDRLHNSNNSSEEYQTSIKKEIEVADKKFNEVNKEVLFYLIWQERLFYTGLILVSLFGVYSIK